MNCVKSSMYLKDFFYFFFKYQVGNSNILSQISCPEGMCPFNIVSLWECVPLTLYAT